MKLNLNCEFIKQNPHLIKAVVTIPKDAIQKFFNLAAYNLSKRKIAGFGSNTPISYIKTNFAHDISNHLKELILKYFSLSHLYNEIRKNKIVLLDEPRLVDTFLEDNKDAIYTFEFNTTQTPITKEWKFVHFKRTERKHYKDIDKQAAEIIKQEKNNEKNYKNKNIVQKGDWINFDLIISDENGNNLIEKYKENFWLKIGEDETTAEIQDLFLNKKLGDEFVLDHQFIQDFFNSNTQIAHKYIVKIVDIIPVSYICFESFKKHFKLKTGKALHEKLVEVFSFNNDLNLRKTLTTEAFQQLFKLYPVETPESCTLRRQQYIWETLQEDPDYAVYRIEPEFKAYLKELAHNQIRENAIAELIAHYDSIEVDNEDVKNYLALTQRPRLSQFLHFLHPTITNSPEDCPIHSDELKQTALREKALNHIIFHLTKE